MALLTKTDLSDLPEELQLTIYHELHSKFGKRRRTKIGISKEAKLIHVSNILVSMNGLNLAEQRSVLLYAIMIIEHTQKRYWRDR